jgi:hypothetical protein
VCKEAPGLRRDLCSTNDAGLEETDDDGRLDRGMSCRCSIARTNDSPCERLRGSMNFSMTKCRKPFGHLLTSFDIFEKDVGGVNEREIFVWICQL